VYQQSLNKQLEQLGMQLHQIANAVPAAATGNDNSQFTTVYTETSLTVLMQSAHKEALEKMKQQQWQQYYTLLLQELQQAGDAPTRNDLAAEAGKKEIAAKVNGYKLHSII